MITQVNLKNIYRIQWGLNRIWISESEAARYFKDQDISELYFNYMETALVFKEYMSLNP